MISRNALYDWLQTLIDNAEPDTPLKDVLLFRNLGGSIDEAKKVLRVECYGFKLIHTNDPSREEQDVDFIIQCFVTPDSSEDKSDLENLDAAKDVSVEMAKVIFRASAQKNWSDITDAEIDDLEVTEGNLGTVQRAVTYLFGKANPY